MNGISGGLGLDWQATRTLLEDEELMALKTPVYWV